MSDPKNPTSNSRRYPFFINTADPYKGYVKRISSVVNQRSVALKGLSIAIIGAGPAGLVLARAAANQGAIVHLLEKAGDPRNDDAGYTNRSFNITLDNVGRMVLGEERAWKGGNWIRGRAVHEAGTGKVHYADYGPSDDDKLVSIPRSVLRQNLCDLAQSAGARMSFNVKIHKIDCDKGLVSYTDQHGHMITGRADLIAFCDGVHSMADEILRERHGALITKSAEKRRYVAGMVNNLAGRRLNKNYMHFWHETKGDRFTIGIPNTDRSIGCLLVDDNMRRPYTFSSKVDEVRNRLNIEYPDFSKSAPDIAGTISGRHSHFWYKTISRYRVGNKAVILGDAACAFPPWAGYGANQAMFGAALLTHYLSRSHGKLQTSLNAYQQQQLDLSRRLLDYVAKQGDFLSGPVADSPDARSDPALGQMIWRSYISMRRPMRRRLLVRRYRDGNAPSVKT